MKRVLDILNLSTDYLKNQGIESPRRQAEEVIADCLTLSRTQLYMEHDRPLNESELSLCRERLARRAKGEPLAYILGYVEFLTCKIHVNSSVLIPRQETEILADKIVQELNEEPVQEKVFVDLCCGSGCLGIAIKKQLPELRVVLLDLSAEALAVAKKNAELNGVDVEFLQGDFLQPLQGRKVHYLVCNPPYVSEEEYEELSREVKDYEPQLALVAPHQGLGFYDRLNSELPTYLHSGSKVWLEIGHTQGPDIRSIFSNQNWVDGQILPDWSGKERFCTLNFSEKPE